jgi:hypothetical protein
MITIIAALALVLFAASSTFAASSDTPPTAAIQVAQFHRGPWPIQNGFDHQPTQQDLPPDVLRDEGHVTPSQRDFDKTLQICRPC